MELRRECFVVLFFAVATADIFRTTDPTDAPIACPTTLCAGKGGGAVDKYFAAVPPQPVGMFFSCRWGNNGQLESHGCQMCQANLLYNEVCGACLAPNEPCPVTEPSPTQAKFECKLKKEDIEGLCPPVGMVNIGIPTFFYPDPEFRRFFIQCENGEGMLCMVCPAQLVWDNCLSCCNYAYLVKNDCPIAPPGK